MLTAAPANAAEETVLFTGFDIFMIVFTLILAIGLFRLASQEQKNFFAIGFTAIALLVFLFLDYHMIRNWFGLL